MPVRPGSPALVPLAVLALLAVGIPLVLTVRSIGLRWVAGNLVMLQ
jgi:hypothetical protein